MLKYLLLFLILPQLTFSQLRDDWHHLDPETDGILGISTYKAYEFLKDKKSTPVVVAVIDNGAEISHEDLTENIWININEIPENGIDDDKNGFIDDIHGWNFLGNAQGVNMKYETLVTTRYYKILSEKFNGKSKKDIDKASKGEFNFYRQIKEEFETELKKEENYKKTYQILLENYLESKRILDNHFQHTDYEIKDVETIKTEDKEILWAIKIFLWANLNYFTQERLENSLMEVNKKLESRLNPDFNKRQEIIGDNPGDITDSIYGNNNVAAAGPYHGTSVAGIIGALDNEFGITGIAKNVQLMILRVVPNGDERDKDVALAIRYAVRNGADVINCSFAKDYMMHPEFIYDAMKEAENAGVLIVHSAGNESRNHDKKPAYPNGFYADGTHAQNWMNIGATMAKDSKNMIAYFSNYGKKSVDVFAPGTELKTTALNNEYTITSGTSIAAPVVSGIAAVLKSYYPQLTAAQIREIIIKSAYKPNTKRVHLVSRGRFRIPLNRISISGGIANLYNAVILAEDY